jgi:hypothetical protein
MAYPSPEVPSPEAIASWNPSFRRLYEYWRYLHPTDGRLPGRQHFDPLDIADLMPLVWMLDIDRSGADILTHPHYPHYLQVAGGEPRWRRGRPGFHTHPDYFELEQLLLPTARDGTAVDVILAITVYFGQGGALVV